MGANAEADRSAREDRELVARARTRDEDAFRRLVEKYQERAFWIARGMVGNDEDSRDVAQEAFVRVYRSLDRFDPRLKFYTWFYQIVVNLSIDHLRRAKHRRGVSLDDLGEGIEPEHDGVSAAKAAEQQEIKQRVERVLAELPEKYRAVMVLRDLQGQGGKDVAEVEGATHATVRWRLHRARKLFRAAWERLYGTGDASSAPGSESDMEEEGER